MMKRTSTASTFCNSHVVSVKCEQSSVGESVGACVGSTVGLVEGLFDGEVEGDSVVGGLDGFVVG